MSASNIVNKNLIYNWYYFINELKYFSIKMQLVLFYLKYQYRINKIIKPGINSN